MTPEEIERTIQFILQHEAEVFPRIDRLSAASERHDREISQLTDLAGRLAQAEIHLVERMDTLAERMDTLAERMGALAERMDALAATHKETDERLNALILTVERYIAGRNGDSA